VAGWSKAEKLYLAVLIDDSLGQQRRQPVWSDLTSVLRRQAGHDYISVAYARNGNAMLAQDSQRS